MLRRRLRHALRVSTTCFCVTAQRITFAASVLLAHLRRTQQDLFMRPSQKTCQPISGCFLTGGERIAGAARRSTSGGALSAGATFGDLRQTGGPARTR